MNLTARFTRVAAFRRSYFLSSLSSRSGAIRATTRAGRGELSLPAAQHFKSLIVQFRRPANHNPPLSSRTKQPGERVQEPGPVA
jgi:hypothetical protein